MRITALFLLILFSTPVFSETIRKWIDNDGNTHYGDSPPKEPPLQIEEMKISDDFDADAYEMAVKRNRDLAEQVRKIEQHEQKNRKEADKRLDKYLDYLDKKEIRLEKERARIRKAREKERNATSIKIRRTKQTNGAVTGNGNTRSHK